MTSPYSALGGLPGFGGGAPAPLQGLPGFSAPPPPPQAVGQPGTVPQSMFGAPGAPGGLQAFDANRAPVPGVLATVATQTGRGALDALLGSGAILGAAIEGTGALTNWKGAEDFGRDLGQSSNGAAGMEAASFLFGKATDGNKTGLTYADRAEHAIQAQEQAWPLLTTVSRIGGGVGLALATGGLSGAMGGAGATLGGTVGIGAYEGAAGGLQAAYAANESLRDVLVSGVTGAAFGAFSGGVVHGVASLPGAIAERSMMRQVFGDVKNAAEDVAAAIKDAGGSETYEAAKVFLKERADVLRQVTAAGDNPSLIRQAYDRASRSAGEKLSQMAGDFDPASWATKTPSPIQKLLHRTPLLDQVSEDLAGDAASLVAARPTIDFALKVPKKLLADADGTAAIAGLQARVTQAVEQMPDGRLRDLLLPASERLAQADAAGSMAVGHELVNQLSKVARATDVDQVTAAYAQRQASAIADELGGDAWGSAGKAYKSLTRLDSAVDNLDPKTIREALKHADSSRAVPGLFAEESSQLTAAYAARKQLGGEYMDDAARSLLKDTASRAEKAHAAVTFDGGPARRVLDVISGAGRNIGESYAADALGMGVGMMIGGVPGMILSRALAPVLGDIASAAFGKGLATTGRQAGGRLLSKAASTVRNAVGKAAEGGITWQQYDYTANMTKLAAMVGAGSLESAAAQQKALSALPPEIQGQAGAEMTQKLSQLMADIPKPTPNIRGKAWESLSNSDLRKAQAMWEATTEPMSVFADFTAGNIDYDKVRYAWKQYPGLQQASQAGLMDIIHSQLDDKSREGISDGMLTQLDNLFGFDGQLQPTLDSGFSQRMSALMTPEQNNPAPQANGPLKMPGSQPTFTERIAGARA